MKIYLFLKDDLLSFSLPKTVYGNFSFDENIDEESKLINIKAKDSKWFIYSTNYSKLKTNNPIEQELENNHFYTITRGNQDYVIYVYDSSLVKTDTYLFKSGQITIGEKDADITYSNVNFKITRTDATSLVIESGTIYVNKKIVNDKNTNLRNGDLINALGLKILVLNNFLIISSPSILSIKEKPDFRKVLLNKISPAQEIDIKDRDLYKESDYFSKSPRIRRIIETKKITLSDPPREEKDNDLPFILTVGPMVTMGLISVVMIYTSLSSVVNGQSTMAQAIPSIIMSSAMLVSMIFWPLLTRNFNRKKRKEKNKEINEKYTAYLELKDKELEAESRLQSEIILENLISLEECSDIIKNKKFPFWNKRIDQNDFLSVRVGIGNAKLDVEINDPKDGFTIEEDELKEAADKLREKYKYIANVPISYSFYDAKITAIMGEKVKRDTFLNNCILELTAFYSYEDLKIVVLTNEDNSYFDYVKYMNHNFTNERDFRFFSKSIPTAKEVIEYLMQIVEFRKENKTEYPKPHYLIITDIYDKIKRFDLIKEISEFEDNIGFSVIILDNNLSNLPSKCNNFISIGDKTSGIMENAYEKQTVITFTDEVNYSINMMDIAKTVSNIPIDFEEGISELPDSISYLEMEKVGKVEQLNILNRWDMNDSTQSLAAPVGVSEGGDIISLDLHERAHGPHGLIAGMTGSGKSEFIITYVLSLSVNYSPDDVSFIIIDYKGGGLAGAFENKATGKVLPHLAGTITNLDKAEMNRSLVSINSELKRRQNAFNTVRDALGESTMDIYKYQSFYKQGRINEAIPHLFIICDEFAELKMQQPDFMESLISTARIGRSLGVHLILATQKPSGIVNDQIWSNTKFRICLKVQDETDSKEVLKRGDAASIKEVGRFYLQVGFDEYFILGQSAWCGAKYFPTDKIIKTVDKSVNFINDCGQPIKSLQSSSNRNIINQGEELSNILDSVIEAATTVGKKSTRLWLPNIDEDITIDYLKNKYSVSQRNLYDVIIGEFDAPKMQKQNVLIHNLLKEGNTLIYGQNGKEREKLLNTIIFESIVNYNEKQINYYIVDFGGQTFGIYNKVSQIGDIIYATEEEKYNNLFKMLEEEISKRKEILSNAKTDYVGYIKAGNEMPLIVTVINNFDAMYDYNKDIYDTLPNLVRDSKRYGLVYIITATSINSISTRLTQNFTKTYALKMKDPNDYSSLFNKKVSIIPKDYNGRGIISVKDEIFEFQTASIAKENETDTITKFLSKNIGPEKAKKVPILPKILSFNLLKNHITDVKQIPIGISKNSLEVNYINLTNSPGYIITSNKLENTIICTKSLLYSLNYIKDNTVIIIDGSKKLKLDKKAFPNYFTDDLDETFNNLNEFVKSNPNLVVVMFDISKIHNRIDKKLFDDVMSNIRNNENTHLIAVDSYSKLKLLTLEPFFQSTFDLGEGLFIGRGMQDQNLLKLSNINKEMLKDYKNDFGFIVDENYATLIKIIDYISGSDIDEK